VLPGNLEAAIFGHSLKTYGWGVYLAAATVLILCAFLVLSGSHVGRWVGIVAGATGCNSAIWWMPFLPDLVAELHCHRRSGDLRQLASSSALIARLLRLMLTSAPMVSSREA